VVFCSGRGRRNHWVLAGPAAPTCGGLGTGAGAGNSTGRTSGHDGVTFFLSRFVPAARWGGGGARVSAWGLLQQRIVAETRAARWPIGFGDEKTAGET